jgi:hypothetical protein
MFDRLIPAGSVKVLELLQKVLKDFNGLIYLPQRRFTARFHGLHMVVIVNEKEVSSKYRPQRSITF